MQLPVAVQKRRAPAIPLQLFISAGYYMRHPTKASGCLDWSTLSLPTGHRDMRSKRETTVHVQLKHQKAQAALPTFAETDEARGHISRWVGQPGSLADKPLLASHCYYQGEVKQVDEWPHQKAASRKLTSGRRSRWHKCSAQALPLGPFSSIIQYGQPRNSSRRRAPRP